jgi:hypothetical protein
MTQDTPATGQPGPPPPAATLSQVWSVLSTVVAPATLVTALLFYFGYVSARAQFAYFGLDVDALGYSTQEFVMRAPQPLLVPVLVLLLATAGLTWLNSKIRTRLRSADPQPLRRALTTTRWAGAVLLAAGLVMLLAYSAVGTWALYPLITPALLAAGSGLLALSATWQPAPMGHRRTTVVLLVLVVVASVFWVTATIAQWSGTGQAKAVARDLTSLPAVVIDTPEALIPRDPTVVETTLPPDDDQTYRFRYRGLRLLAEGRDRLFLVPEQWSSAGSTYVINFDDARVRFRFVNDPP